jgi:hypothetical protein
MSRRSKLATVAAFIIALTLPICVGLATSPPRKAQDVTALELTLDMFTPDRIDLTDPPMCATCSKRISEGDKCGYLPHGMTVDGKNVLPVEELVCASCYLGAVA